MTDLLRDSSGLTGEVKM